MTEEGARMIRGRLLNRLGSSVLPAVALVACLVSARAETALPEPVHQGDVTYISGGFGVDEQQAMKAAAKDYNLAITNADKAGNYTASVDLVITAKGGREVLRAQDIGPLFYAKLPAGAYRVEALHEGERRAHDIAVAVRGTTNLHLTWP
jgi:hypothetical protein